jgi:uncharacterized membrane protein HdeD (DUF308 family)
MGIASVIVGLFAIREQEVTALALILLVASWLVVSGVFALFGALGLPRGARGKGVFLINAMLSILFGIVIFAWPVSGGIGIAWAVAFYAIFIGISLVGFAFQVRKIGRLGGETGG